MPEDMLKVCIVCGEHTTTKQDLDKKQKLIEWEHCDECGWNEHLKAGELAGIITGHLAFVYYANRCRVTLEPYTAGNVFQIHHIKPKKEGEVYRRDFPYTPKGADAYMTALQPLIEDEPWRYALVLREVHRKIDEAYMGRGMTRGKYNDNHLENRQRLCDLAMETRHG